MTLLTIVVFVFPSLKFCTTAFVKEDSRISIFANGSKFSGNLSEDWQKLKIIGVSSLWREKTSTKLDIGLVIGFIPLWIAISGTNTDPVK